MIKTKKQMFLVIGVFTLVMLLGTTTFAFFNYTRTGSSNVIKTGRISFTSSQDGNINLTNVFPITSSEAETDTTNTDEVVITITGDTTYTGGVEYVVTASDVNLNVGGKQLPVRLEIDVEGNNSKTLGALETGDYYINREGYTTSKYKIEYNGEIEEGSHLLVGYIAPNTTSGTIEGVDGVITIKAYLDKDKILISDTYDGTESEINGTPNSLAEGKTVFTTTEWNSIQANGLSFKVKVEANEGIWVEEKRTINAMNVFPSEITNNRDNIKEIYFNKMAKELMNSTYNDASVKADITYNDEGKVLAWLEENPQDNTKYNLIVASDGDTYLTTANIFGAFMNVEKIEFNNANSERITSTSGMFYGLSKLQDVNVNVLNFENVTNMSAMFNGCSSLNNINLSGLGSNVLSNISYIFAGCNSLTSVDMSNFNFGTVGSLNYLFGGIETLKTVNLSNANASNVTDLGALFQSCSSLTSVNLNDINISNVTDMSIMFKNCTNLTSIDLSGLNTNNVTTMERMFMGCSNLVSVNLSGLGSNYLNSTGDIFYGCNKLENVNMSNFNFGTMISLGNNYLFRGLTKLKTVDLSNIKFSNVSSLSAMFSGCTDLTTVYVSNTWNTDSIIGSADMFNGCTSLVGGAGTTYDVNHIDKEYARIDGGTSNPGYLTLKTN